MLDVIKKLFPYALDNEGEDKYALEDEGEDKESSQDESEESSNDTDDSEDEKEPGDTSSFDMIDDVAICQAVTKLKRDLRGMKLADGTRRHSKKDVQMMILKYEDDLYSGIKSL